MRFAFRFSTSYVMAASSRTAAMARGVRATCASNRSWIHSRSSAIALLILRPCFGALLEERLSVAYVLVSSCTERKKEAIVSSRSLAAQVGHIEKSLLLETVLTRTMLYILQYF